MEVTIGQQTASTIPAMFRARVECSPEKTAYRHFDNAAGRWVDTSWKRMASEVARYQQALLAEGLERGSRVAIMLSNSREWVLFDQAAMGLGLVTVPIYVEDRAENVAYILEQTGTRVLLLENLRSWRVLYPTVSQCESLARVVSVQGIDSTQMEDAGVVDGRLISLGDWLFGQSGELLADEAGDDELATIVYTSGTTGKPKGVMLSHTNLLHNAWAASRCSDIGEEDRFLSFLPLSHMFERTAGYHMPMYTGSQVIFTRSVAKLAEDLQSEQPTVLISVPRIYEKVYLKIQSGLADSGFRQALFKRAVACGWRRYEHRQGRASWHPKILLWPLYRNLVADKITAGLGGRLRYAICGGAAMPPEIARTFIGLGVPIYQGYGMTESSPVVTVNRPDDNIPESIGTPLEGVEVKIGDNDELLTRSPSVMLGYWQNDEATDNAIDEGGWLHSGDQARVDEGGHYYITGRIKDIIVMGNGEKLPPKDMEVAILSDPLFEQILIIGEGRPVLSAVAVLDPDQWAGLCQKIGLDANDHESLVDSRATKAVLQRIRQKLDGFPGYAKVRLVHLELEPWTVESGLLTPTLKKKRSVIFDRYADEIEALYAQSRM